MPRIIIWVLCAFFLIRGASAIAEEKPAATIREYGRFVAVVLGAEKAEKTSGGINLEGTDLRHIETTKTIPCRVGEIWGFAADLHNLPKDRDFTVRSETLHPAIKQPDGSVLTKSVGENKYKAGTESLGQSFWCFQKGYEYELVPGQWTMKIFVDDQEVASMTFEVVK